MNYLTFANQISRYGPANMPLNYLVSGTDPSIRNVVLNDLFGRFAETGRQVIILDDTYDMMELNNLRTKGFSLQNGLSGEFCLYDPINLKSVKNMSRLRCLLQLMDYTEQKKQKLIAYINFISYLRKLSKDDHSAMSLEVLSEYSSAILVEEKLQELLFSGIIDQTRQMHLLGKYSEICSAAADFEDTLFLLAPFIMGNKSLYDNENARCVKYFKISEMDSDHVLKNIAVKMIAYTIEDAPDNIAVVVFDKGKGDRNYIMDFLSCVSASAAEIHMFSEDIFTLGNSDEIRSVSNCFSARIYTRHTAMDSCLAIEKEMGDIDVVKTSSAVTYDRRWKANKPLDILFGKNKTETYTTNAPCREPKFRKEMIAGMQQGCGIIEIAGNSSIFSV